jgi:hypothetical protein
VGDNLLTFMANRLSMSFANLRCHRYGLFDPVKVTLDQAGAAIGARFDVTHQKAACGRRCVFPGVPRQG